MAFSSGFRGWDRVGFPPVEAPTMGAQMAPQAATYGVMDWKAPGQMQVPQMAPQPMAQQPAMAAAQMPGALPPTVPVQALGQMMQPAPAVPAPVQGFRGMVNGVPGSMGG